MKNKKTLISTIIGVTLLVLTIVGATFAYFTTTITNDDGVTNVTGKTDAVGSIALTNPTENLHITLSALDMAQNNLGTYWATNDSTLNYDKTEVQRDIAVATLSGGAATTYYECSTTINVNVSGTMASNLSAGDAYIQFGGLLTDKVDLTSVSSTGYPVTFNLNGTDTLSQSVSVAMAIENRNVNQNSIAGKELSVTFSNDDLVCQVVETPVTQNLSQTIMALEGNGQVVKETYPSLTYTNLALSEYGNVSMTTTPWPVSGYEGDAITDVFTFDETTGKWSAVTSNMTSSSIFYNFYMNIPETGYYKLCYEDNTNLHLSAIGTALEYVSGCISLGNRNANSLIYINQWIEENGTPDEVKFYLQKATSLNQLAGYFYEGTDVNNYVTFNGEKWRIIAVEEGSVLGLTEGEYYTKIIRDGSIDQVKMFVGEDSGAGYGYSYGAWITTVPYTALNTDYYNKTNNYANIGLTAAAKSMIVNPYWYSIDYQASNYTNNMPSALSDYNNIWYAAERSEYATKTKDYVGLIYPSDYKYTGEKNGWLYRSDYAQEWLIHTLYDVPDSIYYINNGAITNGYGAGSNTKHIRPVVYLDSSVKITGGTGTSMSPYKIVK